MRSSWMLLAFSLMFGSFIPTAFSSESDPPSTPPSCRLLFQRIQLVPIHKSNDPMERLKKLSPSSVELELLSDLPNAADLIKKKFHSSRLTLISHNQETSDQAFFHLLESTLHKSEAFYQFQLIVVPSAVEAQRVEKNFQRFYEADHWQSMQSQNIHFNRLDMKLGYKQLQESVILTTRKAMQDRKSVV